MDLERLSHPEYLSDQELRSVLQSYNISVTDIMARCEILELFRKVAQPLPQRDIHSPRGTTGSFANVNTNREQRMDIDEHEPSSKSRFSPQSVNQLGNQFHNVVRISYDSDHSEPIDVDSDTNVRKRQSSSQLEQDKCKSRKLSET